MKVANSLKNKNVKRYLILSIITVAAISIIISVTAMVMFNKDSKEILQKYEVSYLSESFAIEEINNKLYTYIYVIIGIAILSLILVIIFFLKALHKNEKEVKEMRQYLQNVANRNYNIDIENISESEMSNLKSEIYKIVLELKEKSEILANDREKLSNYLADISHQLRTPLMAITVMTDAIIENENNLDDTTRKFIYEISRQLNQINWLVNSLLKMAQLDTKTIEFNIENVDVKELIYTVKNNMEIFLEQKSQSLDIEILPNMQIYIDRKWLVEAIENIIKNCIEYSKENSTIKISCTKNPLYSQILIKDSGKGIPSEELPKIFNKFYKGKNSSSNSFGIGLSLAKSIIESQNGEIIVESKENEGTTFIVKLYNYTDKKDISIN